MNSSTRYYLYISVFGFVSLLLSAVSLLLTFGGHGFYTPLIIMSSPIFAIFGVKSIVIAPLLWMIETICCLRRTIWHCVLFLLLVVTGYIEFIYMIQGHYSGDLQKCFQAWFGGYFWIFTIMIAIYATTQIVLWVSLLNTWSSKNPRNKFGR